MTSGGENWLGISGRGRFYEDEYEHETIKKLAKKYHAILASNVVINRVHVLWAQGFSPRVGLF